MAELVTTQRGAPKMILGGFAYRIASKHVQSLNWRCDITHCGGRGKSSKDPPYADFNMTKDHDQHAADFIRMEVNIYF